MTVMSILDQLSINYGKPTPAMLESNDNAFRHPYSVAAPPKLLFWQIEECAKIALLGHNSYTNCQLINNVIQLLLTTGLYLRPFEEWDRMIPNAQTWTALRTMIQDLFQRCLNATAPTAGQQGYAPALPFQQNAFGSLEELEDDNNNVKTVATQVAALTYQSQLTASTAVNTSERQE